MLLHNLIVIVESPNREASRCALSAVHHDTLTASTACGPHFHLLLRVQYKLIIGIRSRFNHTAPASLHVVQVD